MNTQKTVVAVIAFLTALSIGAAVNASHAPASVITDCLGKPYGTAGCPLKSSSSSSVPTTCGNGVVDTGEECDNGRFNGVSNCTTSCTLLYCGDGIISPQLGEECEPDTEEVYALDPDTGQLTTEIHYLQASCGTICTVPTADASGNLSGGCKRKFLPSCPASTDTTTLNSAASMPVSSIAILPSSSSAASSLMPLESSSSVSITYGVAAHCGDGLVEVGEQCDDGVNNSDLPGARCRSNCTLPKCGDAIVDTSRGEQCDDGPNNSNLPNAHCRQDCTIPKCGDGVIDTSRGEQCDDGPNNSNNPNGHCRLDCTLAHCGDGIIDRGEECDDGLANSDGPNAHCNTSCKLPKCGDGVIQPGEQCDLGPNNSDAPNSQCRTNCSLPHCGDGIVDTSRGEQCDLGPNNSDQPGALCNTQCIQPKCGDGMIQGNEQCDDGNKNSDTRPNACRTNCQVATCGDGVVDAGEQCDDGAKNGTPGDACTNVCELLKSAAPSASTGGIPPSVFGIALAGFGSLGVIAYILRKNLHMLVSRVAGENVARSIDDIPLDEIEMPWHSWK